MVRPADAKPKSEPQSTVAGILNMKLADLIIKSNQCVKTWFLPIQGNLSWTELTKLTCCLIMNWHLSGMRAGGRSSGSPGPRDEAGPGRDIGLWAPVLLLLLLLCWCLEEEEGVPAAPSPPPYNLANSDPKIKILLNKTFVLRQK